MPTRRSTVEVQVLGLQDLRDLNTALNAHDRALNKLTTSYLSFNAAMALSSGSMSKFSTITNNVYNTLNQVDRSINTTTNNIMRMGAAGHTTGNHMGDLFVSLLKYRAVSAVFEGVMKSVQALTTAMYDMERQAARVQRVAAPGQTNFIRAGIASEVGRTGADPKDVGEAYYQLKTQVKDNVVAFSALQTAMNLVVGTEADARQTTRAMLQIYNQFGDQLNKNVGQAENFRRIGELLAVTWKGADAEMIDITNALKYLGPIAEAAGVKVEQLMGTISALTAEGHRGRMGGTEAAQFIAQILKNYDQVLQGIKGKDGDVWHFKLAIDPVTHGVDLLKTVQNIVDTANRLPVDQARKFLQEISGSMNSFRFLGTTGQEFMRHLKEEIDKATKAMHGQTEEAEALRKTMGTTAQEWDRVWKGMFAYVANLVDLSPVRGWLHDIGNNLTQLLDALHLVRYFQEQTESWHRNVLTGQGPVRTQIEDTRDTVRTAFNRLVTSNAGPPENRMYDLETASRGMTSAQRDMLAHRYLSDPSSEEGRRGRFNMTLMAQNLRLMDEQLNYPGTGFGGASTPANPNAGNLRVSKNGLDANGNPIRTKTPEAHQKALEEAAKKALENAQENLSAARADYKIKLEKFGPSNYRTVGAAGYVTLLSSMVAKMQHDNATLMLNRAGVETATSENNDLIAREKEKRDDELQKSQDKAEKRREANRRLYSAGGVGGNLVIVGGFPFPQEAIDAFQGRPQVKAGIEAAKRDAAREEYLKQKAIDTNRVLADRIVNGLDIDVHGRELGLRANRFGGTPDAEREQFLQTNIANVGDALDKLKKTTPTATEEIDRMTARLVDANAALLDFHDSLDTKALERRIRSEDDSFQLRNSDIEHLHKLRFSKDAKGTERDTFQKLNELVVSAETHLQNVKEITKDPLGVSSDATQAAKRVQEARQNLEDFRIDGKIQKYLTVYGQVKSDINASAMRFLHGQGDITQVVRSAGDSIVNAALEGQIKRFTDPLIQTTTQQILELQHNTDALTILSNTITGGPSTSGSGGSTGGIGAIIAGGVVTGIADVFTSGPGGTKDYGWGPVTSAGGGKSSRSNNNLQKYAGAALAAYSIGSTSAEQGVNAGNFLGGIATGASVGATFGPGGALIGGIAGGIVDLIGGLFHHKDTPTATPQDLNPAYYNAPAGFDVAAYNYSAYGINPTMQNVGFDVNPTNPPIINVFVDGAAVAAKQEVSRQTSSIAVSLVNTTRDRYTPI